MSKRTFPQWILEESPEYKLFSTTPESDYSSLLPYQIKQVNNIFKKVLGDKVNTIIDGTAHIGGDTINFAKLFPQAHIYACEVKQDTFNLLSSNIEAFCSKEKWDKNRFSLYCQDIVTMITENKLPDSDILYLDPPWGGKTYKYEPEIHLNLSNIPIKDVLTKFFKNYKCSLVIVKTPSNVCRKDFDIPEISTEFYNITTAKKHIFTLVVLSRAYA